MEKNTQSYYKTLAELLKKHIREGVYPEGEVLPSENELSRIHNLTRPTVRRALDQLVNDGYIIKHQGKGSIVHLQSKSIGLLSIDGTTSVLGESNLRTHIIVKPTPMPWPKPFFFELPIEYEEYGCIMIERVRFVENIPIFYDINYLPNIYLPRFCSRNFENKSLFSVLRNDYHIDVKGGEQRLRAINANDKVNRYLQVKRNMPVLHLERKINTTKPGFFFFSSLYCNTEEYSLRGVF